MRLIATALTAFLASNAAHAAIVRYDFVTQPLFCWTGDYGNCEIGAPAGTWEGSLTFDESILPGGSLDGATIQLAWDYEESDSGPTVWRLDHSFSGPGGSFSGYRLQPDSYYDWDVVGIISSSDFLSYLIRDSIIDGAYTITFGMDGMPSSWEGYNGQGGSNDPFSYSSQTYPTGDYFPGSDGDGNVKSDAEGTWVRTILAPTPVPLPAGLPLLAVSLVALRLLSRRTVSEQRL